MRIYFSDSKNLQIYNKVKDLRCHDQNYMPKRRFAANVHLQSDLQIEQKTHFAFDTDLQTNIQKGQKYFKSTMNLKSSTKNQKRRFI